MFNFYVVLAGHDKVSDAGRATMCRLKIKAPSLQTKSTKNGRPSENDFQEKTNWRFQTKQTTVLSQDQTTPWNTRPLNETIEDAPCNQEEINRRKIEKKSIV